MTHDELTAHLRYPKHAYSAASSGTMLDAADRLDRYRDALENAKEIMLLANRTLGQGRFDVTWIDEALK
jgi:hypothetical protein